MKARGIVAVALLVALAGCGRAASVAEPAPVSTTVATVTPNAATPAASARPTAKSTATTSVPTTPLPSKRPSVTATWVSTPPNAPVSTPFTVNGVPLVNRVHPLASDYVPLWASRPNGLSPEMSDALKLMFADAAKRGLTLKVRSGYRSYAEQAALYAKALKDYDAKTADLYFAKAGMSEHQSGLAADLTDAAGHRGDAFLGTPEAAYLAQHATDFGFIIRYPLGKTPITGYSWEPWHVRYVGTTVASTFAQHPGLTLEEYLGEA